MLFRSNDSGWANATTYGSYGVSPWGSRVSGFPSGTSAQWIWSANNDADDTVYLRYIITIGDGPTNQQPTSAFSSNCTGLSCSFTDSSSDSDGSIVSRAWNFGDGNTSTSQNPSHSYAADGTYTVSLTVTDDDGATATTSQSVTVSGSSGDGGSQDPVELTLTLSADNADEVYVNGQYLGSSGNWMQASTYTVNLQPGENVIAVKGIDAGGVAAFIAYMSWAGGSAVSDSGWKVSTSAASGWNSTGFDDSGWANATDYGGYGEIGRASCRERVCHRV